LRVEGEGSGTNAYKYALDRPLQAFLSMLWRPFLEKSPFSVFPVSVELMIQSAIIHFWTRGPAWARIIWPGKKGKETKEAMGNTGLFALVLVACAAVPCSAFAPWLSTPAIGIKAGTSGGKLNFVGGGRRHAISADQRGILGATMLRNNYDLVVIGSGPTGLTAALTAAAAGR
jgi:hypothetical protein